MPSIGPTSRVLRKPRSDFQRAFDLDSVVRSRGNQARPDRTLFLDMFGFMPPASLSRSLVMPHELALKLDPNLAIAHAYLLGLFTISRSGLAGRRPGNQAGAALAPNDADVLFMLGGAGIDNLGRWDEP